MVSVINIKDQENNDVININSKFQKKVWFGEEYEFKLKFVDCEMVEVYLNGNLLQFIGNLGLKFIGLVRILGV